MHADLAIQRDEPTAAPPWVDRQPLVAIDAESFQHGVDQLGRVVGEHSQMVAGVVGDVVGKGNADMAGQTIRKYAQNEKAFAVRMRRRQQVNA